MPLNLQAPTALVFPLKVVPIALVKLKKLLFASVAEHVIICALVCAVTVPPDKFNVPLFVSPAVPLPAKVIETLPEIVPVLDKSPAAPLLLNTKVPLMVPAFVTVTAPCSAHVHVPPLDVLPVTVPPPLPPLAMVKLAAGKVVVRQVVLEEGASVSVPVVPDAPIDRKSVV